MKKLFIILSISLMACTSKYHAEEDFYYVFELSGDDDRGYHYYKLKNTINTEEITYYVSKEKLRLGDTLILIKKP